MKDGERGDTHRTPTPLPWKVDETPSTKRISGYEIWAGGVLVAKMPGLANFDSANANFIVKACNAYDSNQATIRELVDILETCKRFIKNNHGDACTLYPLIDDALEKATKEGRG